MYAGRHRRYGVWFVLGMYCLILAPALFVLAVAGVVLLLQWACG